MKTTTRPLKYLMNRASCWFVLLVSLLLVCFTLLPRAQAVCQEGCRVIHNTALGDAALASNTIGAYNNTAMGYDALARNTLGENNTALGAFSLQSNTDASDNTATGYQALFHNIGGPNTASGADALWANTTGNENTAIGNDSLRNNTTGDNNIALGDSAGVNLTTGSNNIDIGNMGGAAESSTIRIGTTSSQTNTYIAGISGATVAGGIGVIVDSNGHLGTSTSSARYKDNIQPMDKTSEAILSLQPVTFRYKKELDPKAVPQFGLVAEQVDKVDPNLVARDQEDKPYSVRYEAVNAMLLNEFLKEHRKVTKLESTVAEQQKQIEALTTGLQKVTAQFELNKSASQSVLNDR